MIAIGLIGILFSTMVVSVSFAADIESRLNSLEEVLKKQQLINQLKEELSAVKQRTPETPDQKAVQAVKANQTSPIDATSKLSGLFGGSFMTNPYISFVLNSFLYSSSTNERKLQNRGIAGFSDLGLDQRKGFNINEGELFLFAPLIPISTSM